MVEILPPIPAGTTVVKSPMNCAPRIEAATARLIAEAAKTVDKLVDEAESVSI